MYERILNESFQLFIQYGIRSITMDDIAKHMGISKRTIYENFRDKDDLLHAALINHKKEQNRNIYAIISTTPNVLEAIYKVMYDFVNRLNQINPTFFSDLQKYHHKICQELIPRQEEEHMKMLYDLIKKGIDESIFRNDINIDIISRILNIQFKATSDEKLFPSGTFSRADVFMNIIVNFTRGISTPKGIEIIDNLIETRKKNKNI